MRAAVFTAVAVMLAGPAFADCAKPDIPACAVEKGAFGTPALFDECRKLMLVYKDGMEKHSSCTRDAGSPQQGQASEDELVATLAQFNKRARGE